MTVTSQSRKKQSQEKTLVEYEGLDIKERTVRLRDLPTSVAVSAVTIVALTVLGVNARSISSTGITLTVALIFGGYLIWMVYEKRKGQGPAEPGGSSKGPRPDE